MKLKLVLQKGGRVKILAPHQPGSEKFTLELAKSLGSIVERHQGHFHTHEQEKTHVHVKEHV